MYTLRTVSIKHAYINVVKMEIRMSDVVKSNVNVYVDGNIMNFNRLNNSTKYNMWRKGSMIESFIPIAGRPIAIGIHRNSTLGTG
jgi:hypothetical protein